jgi:hypothetical protein
VNRNFARRANLSQGDGQALIPTPSSAPAHPGGALEAFNGGVAVVGIEDAVELRAAGVHQFRHPLLGQLLFLHLGSELMCDDGLDGGNRHLLPDAGLIQPASRLDPICGFFFLVMMPSPAVSAAQSPDLPARSSAFS